MKNLCLLALIFFSLPGCRKIDVFEKNVAIKNHEWASIVKPTISFNIEDTTSLYNIFIVLRHSDAYDFSNIWIRCTVLQPGISTPRSQQYNLVLATNEKGWLGTGMDDIFETRIPIQTNTKFTRVGNYRFILEQIMREDPLQHVLNVGLRIEKTK
ncbi:MAG TPA: gliding motility lipoprotein GldH [Chitinophagaceae bacterium]|nr:gliding motility lipoprotein GldH [Chitinophagaceae bacterium]